MNKVFYKSCEQLAEVKSSSARLVIGSPPYSGDPSKLYSRQDYERLLLNTYQSAWRVLKPGGIMVSIATDEKARGIFWSKNTLIISTALTVGFELVDIIIWKKADRNLFRLPYAQILFFSKKGNRFINNGKELNHIFLTKIWELPDTQNRKSRAGHKFGSALHPKIADRIIRRFTKRSDLVVNPFVGSGTILAVACRLSRKWIGYEINSKLKPIIEETITLT